MSSTSGTPSALAWGERQNSNGAAHQPPKALFAITRAADVKPARMEDLRHELSRRSGDDIDWAYCGGTPLFRGKMAQEKADKITTALTPPGGMKVGVLGGRVNGNGVADVPVLSSAQEVLDLWSNVDER